MFQENIGADYVVIRTAPMTPKSNPDNMYYENENREKMVYCMGYYNYRLYKIFDSCEHTRPAIEQRFTDEVNRNNGQGTQNCREIDTDYIHGMLSWWTETNYPDNTSQEPVKEVNAA